MFTFANMEEPFSNAQGIEEGFHHSTRGNTGCSRGSKGLPIEMEVLLSIPRSSPRGNAAAEVQIEGFLSNWGPEVVPKELEGFLSIVGFP